VAFRQVKTEFSTLDEFVKLYKLEDYHAALERIREDRPITIPDDKGNTSKCVADIVSVSATFSFWWSHLSDKKHVST